MSPGVAGDSDRQPSPRWVLHVDLDAFFASVEAKEQPELRGRPVVVGGTGGRGVVASASYEARSYGVHSAMPTAQARKLCPHAVFLPPRFEVYKKYSTSFHEVLGGFSPAVEGIGLDEAFVDISGSQAVFGAPGAIAAQVRANVLGEVGLACAVGAGPSKLVAKLASKAAKPRARVPGVSARGQGQVPPGGPSEAGVLVVEPADVLGFLWPLPVGALWGVGPAAQERLGRLGVATVEQLARVPLEALVGALGKANGRLLHDLSWGRDDRPVVGERAVKSIGHEETYEADIVDREMLARRLVAMADEVAGKVRSNGLMARTVTLKLRYANFATVTRSHTFSSPQDTGPTLWRCAKTLLDGLELRAGVRLLGLSASGLLNVSDAPGEQLSLAFGERAGGWDAGAPEAGEWEPGGSSSWKRASRAVDAVRGRFGGDALRPASVLGDASRRQ
ncbi:MAG TPA: DNA polymerase IV [Acidimicrobiales bacterium]|nr:DNA polymerase IV [Acidimicrobiales bacterium]